MDISTAVNLYVLFCTVLPLNLIAAASNQSPGSLTLVQIIHRHGDRTPERTFPSDPNLSKLKELGFGELTNVGKREQYELGIFLRNRYKDFASSRYKNYYTKCKSSDFDRTIMSAYCLLTGLYPPIDGQVWHENITWQPIPVHMVPQNVDYKLLINKNCELRKNITDSARVWLNKQNRIFYKFLTNKTEMNVTDADNVRIIFEAIDFARKLNWTIPSWANDLLMQEMEEVAIQGFNIMFPDKLSQKLASGNLLKEITANMENKTLFQELDVRQFYIYTTHDTVLNGFLSLLDLYNGIKPPMNSAIITELYVTVDNSYWVQILYRNNSNEEPYLLQKYSWEEFLNFTSNLIPTNILQECNPGKLPAYNHLMGKDDSGKVNIQGYTVIVSSLMVITIVMIAIFAYKLQKASKRNGYNRI